MPRTQVKMNPQLFIRKRAIYSPLVYSAASGKDVGRMLQRVFNLGSLPVCLLLTVFLAAAEPPPSGGLDRKMIALEALTRLKGTDLNTNPTLKAAALKVLEWTRGTPDFVTVV